MALYFRPAISVNKFSGGYKAVSSYTDLGDTETNDALNIVYGPNGDLVSRNGSQRLLQSRLTDNGLSAGEPIIGHYHFRKNGNSNSFHVVVAGDSVFNYSSATASRILTGLSANSEDFFSYVQIQDPRSAADDVCIFSNGKDRMYLWNGSNTAILLSGLTSASQVPIAKYILGHKNRVYAFNILDASDADASVKVAISSFGSDGAPDPHRFLDSFYLGGSDGNGDIRGGAVLNDQIIFYTRKSIWKFNPGTGTSLNTLSLQKVKDNLGLLAPGSLVNVGDYHIFLSEQGVFAFDGVNTVPLSQKVDEDLFNNSNQSRLPFAKAVFNDKNNQYVLYFAGTNSDRNNIGLSYDTRIKVWQPPITGRQVSFISKYLDQNNFTSVIYGDYKGYLYQDDVNSNDGLSTGFNGTVTANSLNTITDSSASFPTANDGLSGYIVRIYEGTGEGQIRVIETNTTAILTLESNWTTLPDTTSKYTVAGIEKRWKSKDFDFIGHDITKLFREINLRTREDGDFNLTVHYIINFTSIAKATKIDLKLLEDGFVWGVVKWGQTRWGGKSTIKKKISCRNTLNQKTNGTHLAIQFCNERANESFRISGFDITMKEIGKR